MFGEGLQFSGRPVRFEGLQQTNVTMIVHYRHTIIDMGHIEIVILLIRECRHAITKITR